MLSWAADDAIAKHGKREIINTDQGRRFISAAINGPVRGNGVMIIMDSKGPAETTCLSNDTGGQLNMKKFTYTTLSLKPGAGWIANRSFIMVGARIPALA